MNGIFYLLTNFWRRHFEKPGSRGGKLLCLPNIVIVLLFSLLMMPKLYAENLDIDNSSPFVDQNYSQKISMDFQDASLVNVLKIFSQQTRFNLVTSEEVANKLVTVYLDQVPVEQALEQILRANNLTYELQPGTDIYVVKPLEKPEVALITRVYPLKYANVTSAKIRTTLSISSDASSSGSASSSSSGADTATGIKAAVAAILTKNGKIIEDPRTNSLIITDIASNFAQIEQTIARLDVEVAQVLIEVEMLEISKETSDKIGIKVGDTPLTFNGGTRSVLYPWNQNQLLRKGYFEFSDDQYTVGTVDASGLAAALQFLRTQTDTKNLARPRILTLNHETAQIRISTNEAIGVTTQTSSAQNIATSSVAAERVGTGVFLTVTPQANLDTGEITMAIVPKVIIARTGSTFSNTTFRDPEERGSQSILRVKDGETIVLGGLLRSDTSKTVTKIPILGDLPFIGGPFRHKDQTIKDRELIIFITPHIISENGTKFAAKEIQHLTREQDIPSEHLIAVQKEISKMEHQ